MSFPNLRLEKYRCYRYVVDSVIRVSKADFKSLLSGKVFEVVHEDRPNFVVHTYTIGKSKYSMLFLFGRKKGRGRLDNLFVRVEYRRGVLKISETQKNKVDFPALSAFLKGKDRDVRGMIQTSFAYPLKLYAPLIELPYSRTEASIDKKLKIRGLDLELESEGQSYSNFIRVAGDEILQKIVVTDLQETLSRELLETKLVLTAGYASALVQKRGAQ